LSKKLKYLKHIWLNIPKKDFEKAHNKKYEKEYENYVGHKKRGLYALLKRQKRKGKRYYNVVYVGMSSTGILGGRINKHIKDKDFTHFSVFQFKGQENKNNKRKIKELERLFLVMYRYDKRANRFNKDKNLGEFKKITDIAEE